MQAPEIDCINLVLQYDSTAGKLRRTAKLQVASCHQPSSLRLRSSLLIVLILRNHKAFDIINQNASRISFRAIIFELGWTWFWQSIERVEVIANIVCG